MSRNFSMIEYFNRLAEQMTPKYRFAGESREDFERWRAELLPALKELLGPMPDPVPLNAEIEWRIESDGLIRERVVFDVEEHMSVPALLCIPKEADDEPLPAILCNHGHGQFGKDSVMGVRTRAGGARTAEIESANYDFGLQMAQHGYVTMAIDWRGFGERADGGNPYPGRDKCNVHFLRGAMLGVNLLALDIWDGMKAIDYLQSRPEVDGDRIGAMGISFGGTMTTWLSLMDERIKAADIICYSDRFLRFAIHRANFCGSQMVPGLFTLCDVPDLQGLIAPRPLLVEMGVYDQCFYIQDALSCFHELEKIYEAAGARDRLDIELVEGAHEFGGNKAFSFFDKYLKDRNVADEG